MKQNLISDFIPVAEYLDDALVIKITSGQIEADLKRYRNWREAQYSLAYMGKYAESL